MAKFCLLKNQVQRFKQGLKNKEIDPVKLQNMSSEERRSFLAKYVGEENAKQVNALFERNILLKNQKAGMIAWAKKVGGLTKEVRNDLLTRIERLDKVLDPQQYDKFLEDLAQTRLGLNVSEEEANTIFKLSKQIKEYRQKANEEGEFRSYEDKMNFGEAKATIEDYVNDLKLKYRDNKKLSTKLYDIVGIPKSVMSSFDNSFFGRQGIKVLYTNPDIWIRSFLKSFRDITNELRGREVMKMVRADIYSRKNSLNGKYVVGKYGLDVFSEEAFPSSIPEKIPVLKRLFKASSSAYNAAALRMRADLADRYIALAEKNGLNMLNKEQAVPIGHLVGSLTGRGSLGKAEVLGKEFNIVFFSIKFLKSNLDTVTFGLTDSKIRSNPFARKEAAKATLRIIATIAAVLATAKLLDPDSVDEDPTSTNFGKIKVFGHWVDITGGMGAIVRLGARMVAGRYKNAKGEIVEYKSDYGMRNFLDEIEDFIEGKFSPIFGLFRDMSRGEMYGGEPFSWTAAAKQMLSPLPIQNISEIIKSPKSEFIIGSIILELLGFSASVEGRQKSNFEKSTSQDVQAFKNKIGDRKFQIAVDDYNRVYNWWLNDVSEKESYKKLSPEAKDKLKTQARNRIKLMIFKANNFKYVKPKTTQEEKIEAENMKKLLP